MSVQLEFLLTMFICSIVMFGITVIRKHWNEMAVSLFFAFSSALGIIFLLLQ